MTTMEEEIDRGLLDRDPTKKAAPKRQGNRVYVKTQVPRDHSRFPDALTVGKALASTSAIDVTVVGQIAWINRLFQAAGAHGGYNTPAEKAALLRVIGDARGEFQEQAAR
ncbi:MAG: hypothetical protein ACREIE_07690 [Nitrospiraceae bacterium]